MQQSPTEILEPSGRPLGRPGSSEAIRELPGGQQAAEELFKRLSEHGTDITPPGHTGQLVQLLGGGYVGYRPRTRSGPPTIDVNIPGLRTRKLKFPGI